MHASSCDKAVCPAGAFARCLLIGCEVRSHRVAEGVPAADCKPKVVTLVLLWPAAARDALPANAQH